MNPPCENIGGRLDAYLSGELPPEASQEIQRHLEGCAGCAADLEARARVRDALRSAVRATPLPAGMEGRIRGALRAQRARPRTGLYAVAAAAVIVLGVSLAGYLRTWRSPEEAILAKTPGRLAAVLNVGLRDHLYCALAHKPSQQPAPAGQIAAELGARFAGLAPLIQARLPVYFRIMVAHRCVVGDRRYTHFIIAGGGKLVSLILTPARPGESLSEGIYQAGVDRFQVIGFESHGQLAYVISDLDAQESLQWAANLAPAVRQYLAEHQG